MKKAILMSLIVLVMSCQKDPSLSPIPIVSVTDVDGNKYSTVRIGTQIWMSENLKTTKYCNGDIILNVPNVSEWNSLTTGGWAHYDNDGEYEDSYGKLYNWYAVADDRNICPCNWHVPTDAEWKVLTDYLGGNPVAGGKMKSTGTQYWTGSNADATNESGFSGLPGGYRGVDGLFYGIGTNGYWWSSTGSISNDVWSITLYYFNGNAGIYDYTKSYEGYSVRCLMD
jgi:uncharacterized protein (TIGR02145 family)